MSSIKVLIIGAYPTSSIYGGFVSDCEELRKSSIYNYNVLEFDSSQKSNPPPSFIIRLYFSLIRFYKLLYIKVTFKPSHVIALIPSGLGAAEKLFYTFFIFRASKVLILPRAGRFFEEVIQNRAIKYLVFKNKNNFWLVQGFQAKNFLHTTAAINNENLRVIYPLISPQKRFFLKTDSILKIIYVGWLEKEKGILDLIKLCDLVKKPFQLDLYGDGTLRGHVEALISCDPRVKLYGFVDRNFLLSTYRNYDLIILPSYTEGFPNSIAESMANGLAVLSSNVGDIPDFINAECLFAPGDISKCANILSRFMQEPSFLCSQKNLNYEFACKHFGVSFINDYL
jgi:glycosyltransferase involved in cell wall biosynthesis